MKRILALICTVVMLFSFTACSAKTEPAAETTGTTGTATATETPKEVITLKVSCQQVEDHETTKAMRRIAEKVKTETNGGLILELYPNSVLGDYTTIFEELMLGTIDMSILSLSGQYDPRLELTFIPYLFTDYKEAKNVFGPDSNMYGVYEKIVGELGLEPMGIYGEGFVCVGTKKLDPNYSDPTAKKETLLRVPAIDSNKMLIEAMDYPTVTINYSDLFSAIQTGVCDGWFGGTAELNYVAFRDAIKYFVRYNALLENGVFLMNEKKFEALPEDYQKLLKDACIEECLGSYDRAAEVDAANVQKLKDYGIEIVELTPEQMEKIAAHVREETWPKLEKQLTPEVMDAVRKDIAK